MRENEKEEVAVDDMVRRSVGEAKLGGGREEAVEEGQERRMEKGGAGWDWEGGSANDVICDVRGPGSPALSAAAKLVFRGHLVHLAHTSYRATFNSAP